VITHNHKASPQKAVNKPKEVLSTVRAPLSPLFESQDTPALDK
jgi:hypothetical protein